MDGIVEDFGPGTFERYRARWSIQKPQGGLAMIPVGGAKLRHDARLTDKLMVVTWVTTNMSQRIGSPIVYLPARVTFNVSQLAVPSASNPLWTLKPN